MVAERSDLIVTEKSDLVHIFCLGKRSTFTEFARAISISLNMMGYRNIKVFYMMPATLQHGQVKPSWSPDINIVVNSRNIFHSNMFPDNDSVKILIYTEQDQIQHTSDRRWDKSLVFFPELVNDKNTLFRVGYSDAFTTVPDKLTDGHDTFFFGSQTPRRLNVMRTYDIYHNKSDKEIWGSDRDLNICSSKMNINLKAFDEEYYFAPIHGMLIICKKKLLFQERCEGNYDIYKPYIVEFDIKEFNKLRSYWLDNEQLLYSTAINNLDMLKRNINFDYNFIECVKDVI